MPIIEQSTYRAPLLLGNGHVQSVLSCFLRRTPEVNYTRERLELEDGDFVELDWSTRGYRRLAVISYGMESCSNAKYVIGAVRALNAGGWDVVVWNYRSCGGAPNRKVHFYHGGLVGDLQEVIAHALKRGMYKEATLIGFSLGGNLTLNYLGRRGSSVPDQVRSAIAVSAPTDLEDCAHELRRFPKSIYARMFLRTLRARVRAKMLIMPDKISDEAFRQIRTLEDYDTHYTVPHFGFKSVPAYYRSVSSRYVLHKIAVPTLVLTAKDDPFMGPECFPVDEARRNPNLFLEMPETGGHLGFISFPRDGTWWVEKRVLGFLEERAGSAVGAELAAPASRERALIGKPARERRSQPAQLPRTQPA